MKLDSPPSNLKPGPWKEISRENGIRIVETPDFDTFSQFVNVGFGDLDCDFLWRGQRRSDWEIASTLARSGKQDREHIYNFRDAVARCTGSEYDISDQNPNAKETRLHLWALGQHHGLITPLIDWTIYPYAALFFAFIEPDNNPSEFRAVFALCWRGIKELNFHITEDGMKTFKEKLERPPYDDDFKKYLLDNFGLHGEAGMKMIETSSIPSHVRERICEWQFKRLKEDQLYIHKSSVKENKRIHSQGGFHIYTPNNLSIETWIRTNQKHAQFFPILVKVLVPDSQRAHILRCLNKMNINYLSLFPDYEGAVKYCNMALAERPRAFGLREY